MSKLIVIIPSWIPTSKSPFGGRIIFSQFNDFVEEGTDIRLAYVSDRNTPKKLDEEFFKNSDRILSRRILFSYKKFWITRKLWESSYFSIIKQIGVDKIGLIHAHSFIAGYIAYLIKLKFGIPYIVTERSAEIIEETEHAYFKPFLSKIYFNARKIICVSTFLGNALKDRFNIKSTIIPNYITQSDLILEEEKFNEFTIILVCDIEPIKNPDFGLEVLRKYKSMYSNDNVFVVGKGWDRVEGIEHIEQLSNIETVKLISKCHLLVSFSHLETFGMTILEALYYKTLVLVTDSGGPRDFVPKQFIVDASATSDHFVDNITRIKSNYALLYSAEMFEGIKKKYSKKNVLKTIIEIYSNQNN